MRFVYFHVYPLMGSLGNRTQAVHDISDIRDPLNNKGIPRFHPFIDGIFPDSPPSCWGTPSYLVQATSIYLYMEILLTAG